MYIEEIREIGLFRLIALSLIRALSFSQPAQTREFQSTWDWGTFSASLSILMGHISILS